MSLGPVKLSEIKKMPPLPLSVSRLSQIVADPDARLDEVISVIRLDEALTVDVLRWANSAWSQSQIPVTSIRYAVIRLGAGTILKLAVGSYFQPAMQKASPGYQLEENELWKHSVAAALAAEKLPDFSAPALPSSAFTAALLHDIGKLILGRHLGFEKVKLALRDFMNDGEHEYIEAEQKVLGTNHAEIGAVMARYWKIPDVFAQVIARHHDPDAEPDALLDAVHVSNLVAKVSGKGLGLEGLQLRASTAALQRLGLDSESFQRLCAVTQDQFERTQSQWKTGDAPASTA